MVLDCFLKGAIQRSQLVPDSDAVVNTSPPQKTLVLHAFAEGDRLKNFPVGVPWHNDGTTTVQPSAI